MWFENMVVFRHMVATLYIFDSLEPQCDVKFTTVTSLYKQTVNAKYVFIAKKL